MSPHLKPLSSEDQVLLSRATGIGLVGGPGSGKGTQCALLLEDPTIKRDTVHISIGDVMRREADAGGEHSAAIKQWHAEGVLGDVNVTMAVLRRVLLEHVKEKGTRVFILDGEIRVNKDAHRGRRKLGAVLTGHLLVTCRSRLPESS